MPGWLPSLIFTTTIAAASVACGNALPIDGDAVAETTDAAGAQGKDRPTGASDAGGATDPATDARPAPTDSVVFVTSASFPATSIRGVSGADEICNLLASGAAHLLGRAFVAWLSIADRGAKERLKGANGPWVRVDGVRVADDLAHLVGTAPLHAAIDVDEDGISRTGDVWTGTAADGSAHDATCYDWEGYWEDSTPSGLVGGLVADKPDWSARERVTCAEKSYYGTMVASERRLYCFEKKP